MIMLSLASSATDNCWAGLVTLPALAWLDIKDVMVEVVVLRLGDGGGNASK